MLHIDLDAFFASVEVMDDPTLRGKPVAVGGGGARGVIASASYEARRYGVHSAMASVVALRRCPELVILPGRFDRYEAVSRCFHELARDVTPVIEPLGLDELFADLRSLRRLGVRPVAAAVGLRHRVREELGLNSGVGLGSSKLFAKLASKRAKPQVTPSGLVDGPGVAWLLPDDEVPWLSEQPVRALWGVGPATAARLHRLGITLVGDLQRVPESSLAYHLGPAMAHALVEMAHGRDARPVTPDVATKSIGHEETFATSLHTLAEMVAHARRHAGVVARALRASDQIAHTITLKVRFDDLSSVTRAQTLPFAIDDDQAIGEVAAALCESVERSMGARLLGVAASSLEPKGGSEVQLAFDLRGERGAVEQSRARQADRAALNDAVDDLRRRFGRSAVGQGAEFADGRVDVGVQRGSHAFGPEGESDSHRP